MEGERIKHCSGGSVGFRMGESGKGEGRTNVCGDVNGPDVFRGVREKTRRIGSNMGPESHRITVHVSE